jgi:hypothetical protein
MKNLFQISEREKQMILEMHKIATKNFYIKSVITETRKTEDEAYNILKNAGIDENNAKELINRFNQNDTSENKIRTPIMAILYVNSLEKDETFEKNLYDIMRRYEVLFAQHQSIKALRHANGKIYIGDYEVRGDNPYLDFEEKVHAKENMTNVGGKISKADIQSTEDKKPIWENENLAIYDASTREICIKFGQGGLIGGQKYPFCIGLLGGSNRFFSYRKNSGSSFYYILDKTRIKEVEDNGDVKLDLSDPLHVVVYDVQRGGKIELTDFTNSTGSINEFGRDVKAYQQYLTSLGAPIEIMKHRPETEEEKETIKMIGQENKSLDWWVKLPYKYKEMYIESGFPLTDEQFDYIIDNMSS